MPLYTGHYIAPDSYKMMRVSVCAETEAAAVAKVAQAYRDNAEAKNARMWQRIWFEFEDAEYWLSRMMVRGVSLVHLDPAQVVLDPANHGDVHLGFLMS